MIGSARRLAWPLILLAVSVMATAPAGCRRQQVEFSKEGLRECLEGRAIGAVRASMGLANNYSDVERLLALLHDL